MWPKWTCPSPLTLTSPTTPSPSSGRASAESINQHYLAHLHLLYYPILLYSTSIPPYPTLPCTNTILPYPVLMIVNVVM